MQHEVLTGFHASDIAALKSVPTLLMFPNHKFDHGDLLLKPFSGLQMSELHDPQVSS